MDSSPLDLDGSEIYGVSGSMLITFLKKKCFYSMAKSVDSDMTPHSAPKEIINQTD